MSLLNRRVVKVDSGLAVAEGSRQGYLVGSGFKTVIQLGQADVVPVVPAEARLDQVVGQPDVLGQQGPVEVGPDDIS